MNFTSIANEKISLRGKCSDRIFLAAKSSHLLYWDFLIFVYFVTTTNYSSIALLIAL